MYVTSVSLMLISSLDSTVLKQQTPFPLRIPLYQKLYEDLGAEQEVTEQQLDQLGYINHVSI